MKILIRSTPILCGEATNRRKGNEIKVVVCRLPKTYSIENYPEFSSFVYDSTNTVYKLHSHSNRWCMIFDIFTPRDDPDKRYHEELHKILYETLGIHSKVTLPEFHYYFTHNVCNSKRAEQYDDYKASSGSGFSIIHNILLPKVLEYYL